MPKNLANPKALRITLGTTTNKTFPLDRIKAILADEATSERMKLYILLMLNIGAYQGNMPS